MTWVILAISVCVSGVWAVVCIRSWPQARLRIPRRVAAGLAMLTLWTLAGVVATLAHTVPQPPHTWVGDAVLAWFAAMITGAVTVFVVDTVFSLVSRRPKPPRVVAVADLYPAADNADTRSTRRVSAPSVDARDPSVQAS